MDSSIPVQFHRLLTAARVVLPDNAVAARTHLDDRTADAIRLADENQIFGDNRTGRVDRFDFGVPPRIVEINCAGSRLKTEKSAAEKRQSPSPAFDSADNRTCITRQLIGNPVNNLPGVLVKGDDAAAVRLRFAVRAPDILRAPGRRTANLHDEQFAFYDRRGCNAEKVLDDVKPRCRVHFPQKRAIESIHAVQQPLRAEDIDALLVNNGTTPRSVVIAIHILVVCRIFKPPAFGAGFAIQTGQARHVPMPGEDEQLPVRDGGRAITRADIRLPNDAQTCFWPRRNVYLLRGLAVLTRAQEIWPIASIIRLYHAVHQKTEDKCNQKGFHASTLVPKPPL